jgi:hypothetical protein
MGRCKFGYDEAHRRLAVSVSAPNAPSRAERDKIKELLFQCHYGAAGCGYNVGSPVVPDSMLRSTCKIGQGAECCRYLTVSDQFYCEKHTQLAATIDARVAAGTYLSVGDNCEGLSQ